MNDLDTRIRAAMGAIVDETPPAVAYEELFAQTHMPPAQNIVVRDDRFRRNRRAVVACAAGLATVASVVLVSALMTDRGQTPVGHANTRTQPDTRPSKPERPPAPAPVPATVTGTEQTLNVAEMPPDVGATLTSPAFTPVEGTQPFALSVDGTTPFVVADIASERQQTVDPSQLPYVAAFTMGTLPIGGQGLGIQFSQIPLKDVEAGAPAVTSIWDFPVPTKRLDVWMHLPATTAFVTLDYGDAGRIWQRPYNHTAGFISTIPEPERFRYVDNPREPKLTAFDRAGNVIAEFVEPAHQ